MSQSPRFSVGLWVLGQTSDRFCTTGYCPAVPLDEQIFLAASLDGVEGVECHGSDFDAFEAPRYVDLVAEAGLVTTNVNTNVWGTAKYGLGAFTHRDPVIRRAAIDEGKRSCALARELGAPSVALWLGADGFDYPFQIDYQRHWDLLIDGIREVGEEAAPDLKVGVEYKLKEPRTHMTVSTVGSCLALLNELNMPNVGGTIDFGHALMSQESPAESVCLLQRYGKLFNVHFNDAWGYWDDDMIPGTIHFWTTIEFLYYCRQTAYPGWFGLDMFPYREDGGDAAQMAVDNIRAMWAKLDEIDVPALQAAQETMGAIETQRVIRKLIF
jgi:xylose isomerase